MNGLCEGEGVGDPAFASERAPACYISPCIQIRIGYDGKVMRKNDMKIFSGTANRPLAERIAKELRQPLGKLLFKRFSDGELWVKYDENIRGVDVFIVQPTNPPAENLLELLIMIDAARRASARRITAVIPYFGYARQDRKDQPRVPISAKLVANLLVAAGADRVLTVDLHAAQIQGFFDIPLDHLTATKIFAEYFQKKGLKDLILVAPDLGRFKSLADRLKASMVLVVKRRAAEGKVAIQGVLGEVKGKNLLIVDDIVSSGDTVLKAIAALKQRGAKDIYVACTHALLCGQATKKLQEAPLVKMAVTDTIGIPERKRFPKLTILTVAPLLAEAILRIHKNRSVSALFQDL